MLRPLIQPRLKQVLAQSISPRLSVLTTGGRRLGLDPAITFYAPLRNNTQDLRGAVDTFARASDGLYLDSEGVWQVAGVNVARFENNKTVIEQAATNVFLNSAAAVTQSISLLIGDYTLSVHESGSVTSSDSGGTATGHGAAVEGSPVTIDVTVAGTILFTVAGSPDYVQVESGKMATSPIITQGASVNRAGDVLAYADGASFFPQTEHMVLFTWQPDFDVSLLPQANLTMLGSSFSIMYYDGNLFKSFDGTFNPVILHGDWVAGDTYKIALLSGPAGPITHRMGQSKNGGSWVWGTPLGYSGSYGLETDFKVLKTPQLVRQHVSDLFIYDENRGTAWVESNY